MSINIRDIKNQIYEHTYNLGSLCKSHNINAYSFYKPITSPKLTALTDQDYYDANDGFNLWTFSQPQLMLNELQDTSTTLWTYEEREAPFRISDFIQYNHSAVKPLELSFIGNNSGKHGDTIHIAYTGDIQSIVNNWALYRNASSIGDLILLIFERGTQYNESGMQSVYIYKVCQLLDFDGERLPLKISDDLAVGEYTAVPCMSTATYRFNAQETYRYNPNSETITGTWFPFPPYSYINFSVTQTSPSHLDFFNLFDFGRFEAVDFTYTPNNFELRDITFTNYVEYYPYNATRQFSVTIEYWYTNCSPHVLLGQVYRTFNADNILEQIHIVYRDTINITSDAQLNDDIISIEQRVSITSLGDNQSETYSRRLEKS